MQTKTRKATFQPVDEATAEQGIVRMVISTYGIDDADEQVVPGAFAETLAEWKGGDDRMPFIFSHMSQDPHMYVGTVLDAYEQEGDPTTKPATPPGLLVEAQMDDDPTAQKVHKLLKSRRVTQASFAYDVVDSEVVQENGRTLRKLKKLRLYEVGPTLIGMNQETELLTVKEAQTVGRILRDFKAGRVLSAKNEELLRDAHEAIGQVLATLEEGEEKAGGAGAPKAAIAVHHTSTSERDWDGPAAEANLRADESAAYYKKAYAWQDPDADETTKAAYKFIHHEVSADGKIGPANVRACQTGVAVLNGARGGTTIPDAERRGVWRHLAAHLEDADYEAPPLKARPVSEPAKDEDHDGKSEEPVRLEEEVLELLDLETKLLQL